MMITMFNFPVLGVIGLELDSNNEEAHIEDSVRLIVQALKKLDQEQNITAAPNECDDASIPWTSGKTIFR